MLVRHLFTLALLSLAVHCGDDDAPPADAATSDIGPGEDLGHADLGYSCAEQGDSCSDLPCCDSLVCERLVTPDMTRSVCEPDS